VGKTTMDETFWALWQAEMRAALPRELCNVSPGVELR
jgi:hypothetical protein